ncbi:uncharacterized protein J4E84_004270 [Alternaria hordeiaustralica]|uniref:uncharacterized protein n=1 Tax=Alternaria hordeiaustralica TaxID=1187925 RepID=UPI0020C2BF5F|nr:uncharacterized protein J4E84_004270 [Alternaria hordeiaustralica]KAI4690089.1 hypothetical protein J4E84_004270 [Alternaria hordeiaustralica]
MDLDAITTAMTAISVPTEGTPVDTSGSNSELDGRAQGTSAIDLINLTMEVPNITGNYPKTLVLDIGGRKFKVSRDTLQAESGLFRHQLSGRFPWEPEMDGSYFLDADPDLFEHLLRFMRRPEVLPLFYDAAKGFDYNLYNRLEAESQYFQIDVLHEWIKNKKYLNAIRVQTYDANIRGIGAIGPEYFPANKTEDWYVIQKKQKVYLCPRHIPAHRGRPELCGMACHKKQAEHALEYEEESYLEVVSVQKETVFDAKVCTVE